MKTTFETHTKVCRFFVFLLLVLAPFAGPSRAFSQTKYDWLQIGGSPTKDGWNRSETTLSTSNASGLFSLFNVSLPSAGDGTPVYLSNASTTGGTKDIIFVLGEHGHLLALDAHNGTTIWRHDYTANPGFHYNNSSPVVDPDRLYVYCIGLDGLIHKTNISDGTEVTTGGWPQQHLGGTGQKMIALGYATVASGTTYLYATNSFAGGHSVGHVTAVNLATGTQNVFNYSASNVTGHSTTAQAGANPWNKMGEVYCPGTNLIYTATSDGGFNPGNHFWPMTLSAINPDGTGSGGDPVDTFTPSNWSSLNGADLDLGSGNVLVLPPVPGSAIANLGVMTGKSATLWLLDLADLSGQGGPGHTGGEIQSMGMPQGMGRLGVMGHFASWVNPADNSVWFFAGSDAGICGIKVTADANGNPSMHTQWQQARSPVQTPVVANGVLYYADGGSQSGASTVVYAANATTGATLWSGATDHHHWSSPIVVNGVLYFLDGQCADQGSGNVGTLKAWTINAGPPPPPPNAPSNLAASVISFSQVNLTWTASTTSGVSYSVFRGTTSGFTPTIANQIASSLNGTSFSDTNASGSTTYYYLVEAVNAGGSSPPSNQASATTPAPPPPPNPPSNLVATAVSCSQINLTWTASTSSGVTYNVYRKESGGGFTPQPAYLIASGVSGTSYGDANGLLPNLPYYYLVTAVNAQGTLSSPTNQASATTLNMITLQAASLATTSSGQTITPANDTGAPGGNWLKIATTAVGQFIQFTTMSIPAGTYQLKFCYRTNPTRAKHSFVVDGATLGSTIDQYAAGTSTYPAITIGNVTFGTDATHTIQLAVTGKNAASTGFEISAVQFLFCEQASGGAGQVADPVFSPAAGTYATAQSVAITTGTSGAAIRYTTDGSTPTTLNGTVYSGPVNIAATTQLKAVAYETGMTISNVTSGTYTIGSASPITIEAESMSHTSSGQAVTNNNDAGASGGVWVLLQSTATTQYIEFTSPSVPAGNYRLDLRYKTNTTRAQHSVKVDGASVGGTIDQYATAIAFQTVTVGNVSFATTGTHPIRLTVTGKNAASSNFQISADSFILTPQ